MRAIVLLTIFSSAAYAASPTGSLNTTDVGLDQNGVCWHRGPASTLTLCSGTGSAMTVTATTVLPTAGNWLVVTSAGVASIVAANGTSTQAGAAGSAYLIVGP
jgi:hypothetical protein